MRYRKAKQREGQPSMTGQMRDILVYLREMKRAGYIWVELKYPFAHGKTLDGLFERDWIFRSSIESGTAYKITGRGEDALAYFDATESRRDGICPVARRTHVMCDPAATQTHIVLIAFAFAALKSVNVEAISVTLIAPAHVVKNVVGINTRTVN